MSLSSPAVKARLRARCLAHRKALSPAQVVSSSAAVVERLEQLEPYQRARLLHTYVASKDNEVETAGLIRQSLVRGQEVAVPVVQPGTRILRHALIQDLGQLQPGRWALPEPAAGHARWLEDLARIDLVIVPGLAFDPLGRRLGLGGGYYDRFLARVSAPKVGLIYGELLLDELPAEAHDVPVDIVITESQTLYCKES
ncbi:MAG: 5-formyltetrahydrofolate cyclo-ligase [Candidatus Latescibacteria bacterium]|nr:5-formyltetrahydrofolate cyclo-ligase [Candidatus Latescibacterota bacterium]